MSRRKSPDRPNLSRRRFIQGMGAVGAAGLLPGCGNEGAPSLAGAAELALLPAPADSGVDHIVQVMMENRSFDHMLGWVPGADGRQAGLSYKNIEDADVATFHLAADPAYGYQGCGWADPEHGYDGGRVQMNGGAMDGFLLTGDTNENPADRFPVGYYTAADLPFYVGCAQHFTVCDRYFHGILASTFPNRIYIHAGATDRLSNTLPWAQQDPSVLPTIWDQLIARGISCANYFSDLPLTGLWGEKYSNITKPFDRFLVDAAAGTLPAVSYFDPFFGASVGASPAGLSRDDHPQADVRDGQVYLAEIYNALRASPNWERTVMIVTYDEWGGFFDHVVPPVAPVSQAESQLREDGANDGRLGFRTPCVILGPRAKRGHVSHLQFDPNSVINLIRWRHGLDSVGDSPRNQTSLNMAHALDFANAPNLDAPDFGVPAGRGGVPGASFGAACNVLPVPAGANASTGEKSRAAHLAEWNVLRDMCVRYGLI